MVGWPTPPGRGDAKPCRFGRAGRIMKEFGAVNAIDCRSENELFIGELINWRVQKITLKSR